MKLRFAVMGLILGSLGLEAAPPDVQPISGPGYDGQIFSAEKVYRDMSPGFFQQSEMWNPSPEMIRQAERALPAALATWTRYPAQAPGPNFPTATPSKIGTNLRFTNSRNDPRPDSIIDDHAFLYEAQSDLAHYKRQYVGVIIKGKKVVYLSFIAKGWVDFDGYLRKEWTQKHWIAVLDGSGPDFWSVLYDPATGKFDEWDG